MSKTPQAPPVAKKMFITRPLPVRAEGNTRQGAYARSDNLPVHLMARPQRELSLLQMQQVHGNQAVQRYLNHPTHTIQAKPRVGMRQIQGILQVVDLGKAIKQAGAEFNIPPELIGVIVMHESQAVERSFFGVLADVAERAQAELQGDDASIGVGQMRVDVAEDLRQKYPQLVGDSAVSDLLNGKRAVRYVAAQLKEIKDALTTFMSGHQATLAPDAEMDMLALGYNIGWPSLRDRNLRDPNFGATVLERVQTIRGRSQYLTKTTAYLPLIQKFLAKVK